MFQLTSSRYRQNSKKAERTNELKLQRQIHEGRIRDQLISLGASKSALASEEAHFLPTLINTDEQIGGVVYGLHQDGFAMLIATSYRVIFLDKKPLFNTVDDVRYEVISGVSFGHAGIGSTVTLHTKIKDYKLRTLNRKCATGFVKFIESRCLMGEYKPT